MEKQITMHQIKTALTCLAVLETIEKAKDSLGGVSAFGLYMALGMDYDAAINVISILTNHTVNAIESKRHLLIPGPRFEKSLADLRKFKALCEEQGLFKKRAK